MLISFKRVRLLVSKETCMCDELVLETIRLVGFGGASANNDKLMKVYKKKRKNAKAKNTKYVYNQLVNSNAIYISTNNHERWFLNSVS